MFELSSFNGIKSKTKKKIGEHTPVIESQIIEQPVFKDIPEEYLLYEFAEELAESIDLAKRTACVVNGSFIFGDFIEALIINKGLKVRKCLISTLSINENNVDSLAGLLSQGYIDELELVVSHWWWSHQKWNIVPYIYKKLDIEDKFQLGVASSHCKICLIDTYCGKKIVIDGSANLLSSSNIEQFRIEDNEALFNFYGRIQEGIVDYFKTIKKPIRGKTLWHQVQKNSNT